MVLCKFGLLSQWIIMKPPILVLTANDIFYITFHWMAHGMTTANVAQTVSDRSKQYKSNSFLKCTLILGPFANTRERG